MLAISIRNPQQTDQFQHESGSLTLGREPSSHPAHLVINDDYVSRRHLIVEPISENRVRLDNVGRNPLQISDGHVVPPGQSGEFDLPVQLRIGSTVIDLAVVRPPAPAEVTAAEADVPGQMLQTISLPFQPQAPRPADTPPLSLLGQAPTPEILARWFETLLSIQRSAVGSTAFYEETARAVVDLVGLDRGLVLLREGSNWKVVAGHARTDAKGLQYSHSVVERAVEQQRTFFGSPQGLATRASLTNIEAVVASPIFAADGKIAGILYGSRDCAFSQAKTGIQPLEAQVVQLMASSVSAGLVRTEMEQRLKQVEQLAAVGQAIAYIIHDLRGPLGNLQQLVEMGRGGAPHTLSREEQLAMIDQALAVSMQLLNDSLEFCRGNVRVEPVAGQFTTLLENHLRLLQLDLDRLGVTLRLEVADNLDVTLDPDRIARVLRNLAKNAGEALRGQVGATVTIGAKRNGELIELYVADNGPGLPAEVRDKLFQPFSTHGKRGGTGFGLAIAKQLVEAHRGRIAVASDSHGTRFTITLPASPATDDSTAMTLKPVAAPPPPPPTESRPSTATSAKRVLLADDSLINQRVVAALLKSAGHQVSVVENGRAAVEAWKSSVFDIILMDVEMPEMDGLEATRAIRAHERAAGGGHQPIVALTGHKSSAHDAACRQAGMDLVLSKPVRSRELTDAIHDLCGDRGEAR